MANNLLSGGFEDVLEKDRIGFYEDDETEGQKSSFGEWQGYLSFNKKVETPVESFQSPKVESKPQVFDQVVGETIGAAATAVETTSKMTVVATKSFIEAFADIFELITGKKMPLIDKMIHKKVDKKPEQKPQNEKEAQALKLKTEAAFINEKQRQIQQEIASVDQKRLMELSQEALRVAGTDLAGIANTVDARSVSKSTIALASKKITWAQIAKKKAVMSAGIKGSQQAVNLHGIAEGSTGGAAANLSSTGGGAG